MPVDIWGREVKVGDLVIPTNESTFYVYSKKAHVVTRLGSGTKIQLNGSSYGESTMMIVVNEQFVTQFGVAAAEDLVAEYREAINEKPVQKKQPSPKFLVYRCCAYVQGGNKPESKDVWYSIVKVQGTHAEMYQQLEPQRKMMQSLLGEYYDNKTLAVVDKYNYTTKEYDRKLRFHYASVTDAMSLKSLKTLKLDGLIGEVFNGEAEEASLLNQVEVY